MQNNLSIQALRNMVSNGPDEETREKARRVLDEREALVFQAHTIMCEATDESIFGKAGAVAVRDALQGEWPVIECGIYSIPLSKAIAHIGLLDLGGTYVGDDVLVRVSMSDWEGQPENWRDYVIVNPGVSEINISAGRAFHKDNPKWIAAILGCVWLIANDPSVVMVDSAAAQARLRTEQAEVDVTEILSNVTL